MEEGGRRRWKKESGYYRQGRVENAFFRYKSIIGDNLRARGPGGQASEAVLACNILNQVTNIAHGPQQVNNSVSSGAEGDLKSRSNRTIEET